MDAKLKQQLANLSAEDGQARYDALEYVLAASNAPVDWAYAVWDGLVAQMGADTIHKRAIATTLLCNLAKSDPEARILKALPAIVAVTHDKSFITARHTIQALWKIGAAGKRQQKAVLAAMEKRFADAAQDKQTTLIRYDLLVGMKQLYDAVKDESIPALAEALIATEPDAKYVKKYQTVWKRKRK